MWCDALEEFERGDFQSGSSAKPAQPHSRRFANIITNEEFQTPRALEFKWLENSQRKFHTAAGTAIPTPKS
jgi:hypothetical protein